MRMRGPTGSQMGLPVDQQAEASRRQSALWHGAHPKHLVGWKTLAAGELHRGFRRRPQDHGSRDQEEQAGD